MYSLEVIKGGVVIDTILLTKPLLKFGRQPDINDIILDHESCSRNHAKLELEKKSGDSKVCLYLTDIGSTHGTYLNRVRLEPRIETRLDSGYQFKFGESSRTFVVVTNEQEGDSTTDQPLLRNETTEQQVSWGFREDATNYDDDGEDDDSEVGLSMLHGKVSKGRDQSKLFWLDALDATQLNEKEQAIFDRLLSLKLKSDNLSSEIERIRSKEDKFGGSSLTEGQMKQIAKNEVAIDMIKERISCDTDALKKRIAERQPNLLSGHDLGVKKSHGEGRSLKRARNIEDDLDDGFGAIHDAVERDAKISGSNFLITSRTSGTFKIRTTGKAENSTALSSSIQTRPTHSGSIETADSLRNKLLEVRKAIELLEREAEEASQDAITEQLEKNETQAVDPLDAFMSRMTSTQFQQEEALSAKRNDQINALRREEARLNDLLRIITSSIHIQQSIPDVSVEKELPADLEAVKDDKDGESGMVYRNRSHATGLGGSVIALLKTQPTPNLAPVIKQSRPQEKKQDVASHFENSSVEIEEDLTAKVALPKSFLAGVGLLGTR